MHTLHRPNRPAPRLDLTPREREVLEYVLAGKPNKLTAYALGISQRTVEVHRSRIFQKMGVRNAIELVAAFYSSPAGRFALSDAARDCHPDAATPDE